MLKERGVELSLTEIELLSEVVEAGLDNNVSLEDLSRISNGGELSEEELAGAAGGFGLDTIANFFTSGVTTVTYAWDMAKHDQAALAYLDGTITEKAYLAIKQSCKTIESVNVSSHLNGYGYGAIIVGGIAVAAGIGAGIYSAVRSRW